MSRIYIDTDKLEDDCQHIKEYAAVRAADPETDPRVAAEIPGRYDS